MKRSPFTAPLALALLGSVASAQVAPTPVTVAGVVLPVGGPTICMQGETHFLECTGVYLKSNVVDLVALEGQNVRLTGVDVGVTCHVIQVVSAAPAIPSLEWCGVPAIGCSVKFKVCPSGMAVASLAFSTGTGFLPVSVPLAPVPEVLLLDFPVHFLPVAPSPLGCFETTVSIPPDVTLLGAGFWLQGARMDLGPVGPLALTNAICLTIGPPPMLCPVPGC